MDHTEILRSADAELYDLLKKETEFQKNTLNLIASESLQDACSLALSGSIFCNKTVVGLPGKQRLGGSEYADQLEILAAKRACEVFGADHANLLTTSGTTANLCAYSAFLSPGDTVLALDPAHGSHASHGRNGHLTSTFYNFVHFGVDPETQLFSLDLLKQAIDTHHPKLVVIGVSSYPRQIDYRAVAEQTHAAEAYLLVDMAHTSGLVAAGVVDSPVPFADVVTASATKTMCGTHTGYILCKQTFAEAIDRAVYPGFAASMHLQTVAAAAYALKKASTAAFRGLMCKVLANAQALADALRTEGFDLLTGGTDCHMMVLDLRNQPIDAPTLVTRLEAIGVAVNDKKIPYDSSPTAQGIRMGTTLVSQLGMDRAEMREIASIFRHTVDAKTDEELADCRKRVATLCHRFSSIAE